jgi:hypothetical protein
LTYPSPCLSGTLFENFMIQLICKYREVLFRDCGMLYPMSSV